MIPRTMRHGARARSLRDVGMVLATVIGILALAAWTSRAEAHHSFSVFDMTTNKDLEGEVVQFDWTNPHTFLWINVTNADGSKTRWGLEGMSPNFLGRRGWSKNTFQPGDKVKVVLWPLKTGEPGGTLQRATLPDGSEVVNFGRGRRRLTLARGQIFAAAAADRTRACSSALGRRSCTFPEFRPRRRPRLLSRRRRDTLRFSLPSRCAYSSATTPRRRDPALRGTRFRAGDAP